MCAALGSIAFASGGCGQGETQERIVIESTPIVAPEANEDAIRNALTSAVPYRIRERLVDPRWELISDVDLKDGAVEVCQLVADGDPAAAQAYVRDKFQRLRDDADEFIGAAIAVSCSDQ